MARLARAEIFQPTEVATVHLCARVVRRCFLFGEDPVTKKNFDHRKIWIEEQMKLQAAQMGIDIIALAVMSNHFHQILRSRPDVVETWGDSEVARRWLMLCPKRKNAQGKPLEPNQKEIDAIANSPAEVKKIRLRLSDISWWMRILCQKIGTRANQDDKENGKFFQGRFKAVRLLDDEAVLACSTYVDLNPIRASMAKSIEKSEFTSGKLRYQSAKAAAAGVASDADSFLSPIELKTSKNDIGPKPSKSKRRCSDKGVLPLSSLDYLQLLDLTARMHRSDKSGYTPNGLAPLLERLGIEVADWQRLTKDFGRLFSQVAGKAQTVSEMRSLKTHRRFYLKRLAS
jgi:hypothetical protein